MKVFNYQKKRGGKIRFDWSFFIALLSLVVAAATLYRAELRNPEIEAFVGSEFQIYHSGYYGDLKGTNLIIPISFVNKSSNIGIVTDVWISVYKSKEFNFRHVLSWRDFVSIKDKAWNLDQMAVSFPVGGKSQETRIIEFSWYPGNLPNLKFEEGTYLLDVYVKTSKRKKPLKYSYSFDLTKSELNYFVKRPDSDQSYTARVLLQGSIERNKILNAQEVNDLFEY